MKLIREITDGVTEVIHQGKRQYLCHGIVGEEGSREYADNEDNLQEEIAESIRNNGREIFRLFNSLNEAMAYWTGVTDAEGYNEIVGTDLMNHKLVFGVKNNNVAQLH
jgi:hypothetical protein